MDVEYVLNGIRFQSACQAFFDPFVRWIASDIVDGDERETLIGMTTDWELLVVAFAHRGESVRLISARTATRQERQTYEDQ